MASNLINLKPFNTEGWHRPGFTGRYIPNCSGLYVIAQVSINLLQFHAIYIGSTKNIRKRLSHHEMDVIIGETLGCFVLTTHFFKPLIQDLEQEERKLIYELQPPFNTSGRSIVCRRDF